MRAIAMGPTDDRAAESLRTIGVMVCLHVQLELSMRRFIDLLARPAGGGQAIVATHRFHPPLRTLRRLVFERYATEPLKLRKFRRWRNRVTRQMEKRNTMIHGAWIDEHGRLRFSRYPRCVNWNAAETCGYLSLERLAKDARLLDMDIVTIQAWARACAPRL
jgi:hypothetical protein